MLSLDLKEKDKIYIYQIIAALTAVTFILVGCLIILSPFFPAILLGTLLTLSAWPGFLWLQKKLNHRTGVSSLIMTLVLAACFIGPVVVIGTSTADSFAKFYQVAEESLKGDATGKVAGLLKQIPMVGEEVEKYWTTLVGDKERMAGMLKTYGGSASNALLKIGGSIGQGMLDLTLGVLIAYFLFLHGARVSVRVNNLIETFGGERGKYLLDVSKNTLIGVVYGMMGSALAQGVLASIGFWIAKVPGATFLGLLTFFVSLIPVGPPIIWVPVALWLLNQGQDMMAGFIVIWGIVVIGLVDNLMRPYFVSRGSNLPFIIVFLGIIGGIMAYGFIGMFIGPTLLSLAYALVMGWSNSRTTEVEVKTKKK